ncbi:MAG TPA: cysteine desulfurase family protein, partial [Ignavibacteria bacterium]|nr:cysteine desulfurase family protein [Ignavibacteria bacterium]
NNTAIIGSAIANLGSGKNHIITSAIEHPAVLETVMYLRDKFGFEKTVLNPDKEGRISPDKVLEAVRPETLLISVMHANNELGTLNDIKAISDAANSRGVLFHSDTVQSIGKTKLNLHDSGVHFASSSLHKIYGPKGIGMLYIKSKTNIDKYLHGGSQERGMRGGTENIPYIAGLKKAFEILKRSDDIPHYADLKKYMLAQLENNFKGGYEINSPLEGCLENILNVRFSPGKYKFMPDTLLIKLDLEGIAVSGSSACSSGSMKASKVLTGIGLSEEEALSSVRISFGRFSKREDIDYFVEKLKLILCETK